MKYIKMKFGIEKVLQSLHRLYSEQSGATAIIAALSLVVLIGFSAFVLDMGLSYNEASRLQNALDSAVLAAVKELPAAGTDTPEWVAARSKAVSFAAMNGQVISAEDLTPIYKENNTSNNIIGIKVSKTVTVEYNFARVVGINSGRVTRSASSGIAPAGAVRGAVPLSITSSGLKGAINSGVVSGLTIKSSTSADIIGIDTSTASGWFGALRFDGSGASTYAGLLANGYSGTLEVGQILEIESGNMSGPTLEGFTDRYDRCTDSCTADSYKPDCPKLVYIPVVEVVTNKQIKIVAFATFFLEECGGNGNNSYIKATYIDGESIPDTAPGKAGEDFGLYVSKLFS